MTTYLLAGGGTAGHVNPLLAIAESIRADEPESTVIVLGTAEGLESRLVPERGFELVTIARIPFPRRPNKAALTFVPRFTAEVKALRALLRDRSVDVVVGFGGYVSAPAYLAAAREKVPLVLHEANAKPGLASKLGARYTPYVGVAFASTPVKGATHVGMPLRPEIAELDTAALRPEAYRFFDLDPELPTILVTGGSLGARSVNNAVLGALPDLLAAGFQVLHIVGGKSDAEDPGLPGYHMLKYCDRMDLALSAADFAISRSGSATVSELAALGIPAVFVPYPVGNGEQRFNAADSVESGGALLVLDKDFTPEWIQQTLLPLLSRPDEIALMSTAHSAAGSREGTTAFRALIARALAAGSDPALRSTS